MNNSLTELEDLNPEEVFNNAVMAAVKLPVIDEASEGSIKFETAKATALSAAAGAPGGLAMAATIPADLAQYVVHAMRISQKLAYLYG